jgi:hypothetical protein
MFWNYDQHRVYSREKERLAERGRFIDWLRRVQGRDS